MQATADLQVTEASFQLVARRRLEAGEQVCGVLPARAWNCCLLALQQGPAPSTCLARL